MLKNKKKGLLLINNYGFKIVLKKMDNIFTTAKTQNSKQRTNEYYVYVGNEDFIDDNNNLFECKYNLDDGIKQLIKAYAIIDSPWYANY